MSLPQSAPNPMVMARAFLLVMAVIIASGEVLAIQIGRNQWLGGLVIGAVALGGTAKIAEPQGLKGVFGIWPREHRG